MEKSIESLGYDRFKQVCLNEEPNVMKVNLSQIDLVDKNTISFQGHVLPASEYIQTNLLNLLNIPKTFINDYIKLFGNNVEAFANFLKTVKTSQQDKSVYLVAKNNTIVSIAENYMPREIFFKVLEDIMNKKPYDIISGHEHNGDLTISTRDKSSEFRIGNFDHETFHPGFTLSATGGGTELTSFLYRLICSNGMVSATSQDSLKYIDEIKFYEELNKKIKTNFVPTSFQDRVQNAMQTMASYKEVESVRKLIKGANKDMIFNEFVENFAPIFGVDEKLKKQNWTPALLNDNQKKSIATDITMWDLVNGLTDFASHSYYGIDISSYKRTELQKEAGDMLNKKHFDTENIIKLN